MSCDRCRDLDLEWPIRSPGELEKAIRVVRANLADHTIFELPSLSPFGLTPFAELNDDGPWPDVVVHRFRCSTCHADFELFAETYHGSGGSWSPVRPD